MRGVVGDSDTIRRQNRGLVLDALRRLGPMPRTALAGATGLSHATITAITADLTAQSVLRDLVEPQADQKARGRPAIRLAQVRTAAYAILFEIDVNRIRCSLVDYGGTLVDRIESALTPESFDEVAPLDFLAERIEIMRQRNREAANRICILHASVQGILDRASNGLAWSPVPGLARQDLVKGLSEKTGLPLTLFKRGRLLAEGTRWLFPQLADANVATVFVGATVAMGMSFHGQIVGRSEDSGTEFGHMVHIPHGALCRCGTRGCIEAYAADYGVLRSAFAVPEKTPPAPAVPPSQYARLIENARLGHRTAIHAFNLAGSAIGYGINRLMTVFDPTHVVIVGPGAEAYPFMRAECEAAIGASLIARVQGLPQILTHNDESEPVFKGLQMKALVALDQTLFAALPSGATSWEAP